MLNIAIKRLALVDKKTKLFQREKRISNWEKLFIKMSESKGHGRRWKFQIEPFRKKADEGYEELIRWIEKDQAGYNEELTEESKISKNSNRNSISAKQSSFFELSNKSKYLYNLYKSPQFKSITNALPNIITNDFKQLLKKLLLLF
jgi:hypothetical protein